MVFSEMNTHTRIAFALAIFAVLFCFVCPVLLGLAYTAFQEILFPVSVAAPVSTNAETPEAAYHRGIYDVCVLLYTSSGGDDQSAIRDCNTLTDQAEESGWYAQPSKGYEP